MNYLAIEKYGYNLCKTNNNWYNHYTTKLNYEKTGFTNSLYVSRLVC